jgi:hemerythrin-like domain-containing protein
MPELSTSRRGLIVTVAAGLAAHAKAKKEEDVSPNEDLMREHGILKRVLLVYRNLIERIDHKQDVPPEAVTGAANLIRHFVEEYHEKLEEDYLFPRFKKAGKLVDVVDVLNTQHQKGRILTGRILQWGTPAALKNDADRQKLRESMHLFVRMYEPHEAREDTVLFPAFRGLVSEHEYDSLGELFEKKENEIFHGDGFEKNVAAVAELERKLGIYDLAQFTPQV